MEGPAYVSFSAGRTSGKMLHEVLAAYDGQLPKDLYVLFFNTGKEDARSLDFVHEVETRWSVPVVWLERLKGGGFRVVTHETAWRSSSVVEPERPFDALIAERGLVPNMVATYCTTELKHRLGRAYMLSLGYEEWDVAVGLRADEPGRVARQRGRKIEGGWVTHPLFDAGVRLADIERFWATQPFDLRLQPHEGNCDLCFKKKLSKIRRIMEDDIGRAAWWAEMERRTNTTFRIDRPSYGTLEDGVRRQVRLNFLPEEEDQPCLCTE